MLKAAVAFAPRAYRSIGLGAHRSSSAQVRHATITREELCSLLFESEDVPSKYKKVMLDLFRENQALKHELELVVLKHRVEIQAVEHRLGIKALKLRLKIDALMNELGGESRGRWRNAGLWNDDFSDLPELAECSELEND